jgi:hypothetical protein
MTQPLSDEALDIVRDFSDDGCPVSMSTEIYEGIILMLGHLLCRIREIKQER